MTLNKKTTMQNPDNFFKLLQGKWKASRSIASHNKNIGTAEGFAYIHKLNDSTLLYKEELDLLISNTKTKSYKEYLYVLENGKLYKKFADDKSLFYQLEFQGDSATGEHLCKNDLYQAFYLIENNDNFSLKYQINGPKKNDVIFSNFRK